MSSSANTTTTSTAASTSSDLEPRYREILIENGIQDKVKEVRVVVPSLGGDHFASRCEVVTILFEDEEKSPVELFVKASVSNSEYAALLSGMEMFEREALFFNAILPQMDSFVRERLGEDESLSNLFPRCYYADDNLIVLENLLKRGYIMKDKFTPHSLGQSSKVLEKLAKFHAVGYAWNARGGEEDGFLAKWPNLDTNQLWSSAGKKMNEAWLVTTMEGALKILKGYPTPGSDKVVEYLESIEDSVFEKVKEIYKIDSPTCAKLLCHGDLWQTNMMFRGEKEGQEGGNDDIVIIDLQTIHVGHPALDISYYLFMATDPTVRRSSLIPLLKAYYEKLQFWTEKLGVTEIFTFEELERDYRQKCFFGCIIGFFMVFGQDGFADVPEVDTIEGDVMDLLTSSIATKLDENLRQNGIEYSKGIVEVYQELLSLAQGV